MVHRDRLVFRVAVAVAVAPILIAAVRAGLDGWFPTWRSGYVAVMTNDVFTRHTPLIGPFAGTSQSAPEAYNFPGATQMYLLAVPVKLLGIRWGMLLGTAAINIAAFLTALWLLRRRVGYRVGLVACGFVGSLVWALGSQVLVDATPLVIGLAPFPLLLVAAWSVADGDPKGLVALAAAGNFLLLVHLKFTITVPMVGLAAVVAWLLTLRRRRAADPGAWPTVRAAHRRGFVAAVTLTVIMWIPPVAQQLFSSQGNLGRLLRSAGGGDTVRSLSDVLGVVFSTTVAWPLWFRDSFTDPHFTRSGPTTPFLVGAVGAVVLLAVTAFALVGAWRRHDRTVTTGVAIATVAYLAWIVSAFQNPSSTPFQPLYFNELWPLAAFTWFVLTVGTIRNLTATAPVARAARNATVRVGVGSVLLLTVVGFAAATVPAQAHTQTPEPFRVELSRKTYDLVTDDVPDRGPVYVGHSDPLGFQMVPAALLALQDRGIDLRVSGRHDEAMYGSDRAYRAHPSNAAYELRLLDEPDPDRAGDLLGILQAQPPAVLRDAPLRRRIDRWSRGLDRLRVPSVRGDDGPELSAGLDNALRRAREAGVSPIRDEGFVRRIATLDPDQFAAVVDVPGVDRSRVKAWFDASHDGPYRIWVYLIPR